MESLQAKKLGISQTGCLTNRMGSSGVTSIRNGGRDGGRDGGRLAGSSSVRSYEQRAQGPMLFIQSQHCLQAESVDALLRGVCGCAGSGIIGSVES